MAGLAGRRRLADPRHDRVRHRRHLAGDPALDDHGLHPGGRHRRGDVRPVRDGPPGARLGSRQGRCRRDRGRGPHHRRDRRRRHHRLRPADHGDDPGDHGGRPEDPDARDRRHAPAGVRRDAGEGRRRSQGLGVDPGVRPREPWRDRRHDHDPRGPADVLLPAGRRQGIRVGAAGESRLAPTADPRRRRRRHAACRRLPSRVGDPGHRLWRDGLRLPGPGRDPAHPGGTTVGARLHGQLHPVHRRHRRDGRPPADHLRHGRWHGDVASCSSCSRSGT